MPFAIRHILTLMSCSFYSETERDWDKELAEDVKGECEEKYGTVEFIKVEKESEVSASTLRYVWLF